MSSSSSTSNPKSSSVTSSSSSSSSGDCHGACTYNHETGETDCANCSDGCVCVSPQPFSVGASGDSELPCEPLHSAFATVKTLGANAIATRNALVRLPVVSDPSNWRNVCIVLDKPWTQLLMPSIGWKLYFIRTGAGGTTTVITPATAATDDVVPHDKVLCAGVTLPEAGGLKQYWVPVTNEYLGAQLQTPEWTVIFVRDSD